MCKPARRDLGRKEVPAAASQQTRAGVVTYANSITLTPGTIPVGVEGNELTVHALINGGALDLEGGGMDRRVKPIRGTA